MKYMGIPLQDVYTSSAVVLTPTPDGQVHLVRNFESFKKLLSRLFYLFYFIRFFIAGWGAEQFTRHKISAASNPEGSRLRRT